MYVVVAVPLNRPGIRRFLTASPGDVADEAGEATSVEIIGQRPSPAAQRTWARKIEALGPDAAPAVVVEHLLAIDSPHAHLTTVSTRHLVPVQFLREPGFLTRNLGGWVPIYFAVLGAESGDVLEDARDPFLRHAEVLKAYGETIDHFGADADQVQHRLEEEADAPVDEVVAGVLRLNALDEAADRRAEAQVPRLVAAIDGSEPLLAASGAPVPHPLLCDALLDRMVRVEQSRRAADAAGDADAVARYAKMQRTWGQDLGVRLILKGEYIAGRHRRSIICLAPSLGLVIKQPGPEPFHDINVGARTHDGEPENWPFLQRDGAVVTPRGRVRIVLDEDVVPPLHAAFGHGVQFSSLLGLIIEDHVPGPTLQAFVAEDPRRLTEDIYRQVLVTQQVCEALKVNNPDWHSANFIVEKGTGDLVHIDWGAARPLRDDEQTDDPRRARIEKVRNFAYSFQDDTLADRAEQLHARITGDPERMEGVRDTARRLADRVR